MAGSETVMVGKRRYTVAQYEEHKKRNLAYGKTKKGKEVQSRATVKYFTGCRLKLIALLGGKCASPTCKVLGGMDDIRCLQVDHKKGGGAKEHRRLGPMIYLYYLKRPELAKEQLQVLCANCNWIKRVENKEVASRTSISIARLGGNGKN